MKNAALNFDVIIAGGGMVGASLACALALALGEDARILVVESFPLPAGKEPGYQPSFDARSTALAVGSQRLLGKLGVWDKLAEHAQPIAKIHVSNRGRPGSTLLDADAEKLPALGYVVENHWLGQVLLARLQQCKNISWRSPARVTAVTVEPVGTRVTVADQAGSENLRCQLLVIADGARSALASKLGISYEEVDYGHTAVIANVETSTAHAGMAFERFTERGPLALLPLVCAAGHSRSALVWTLPKRDAAQLLQMDDGAFARDLQHWFGFRLGKFTRIGARAEYPLALVQAAEQVRPGVVVAGNAAHFIHPVAGQGFNLALRDVDHLAACLKQALANSQALGSLAVLSQYQSSQYWDQRQTAEFSDRIGPVFMETRAALALPRDLALGALDILHPAKSWLVNEATGLGGKQARW